VESLRIDPASVVLGLRVNLWVSLLVVAGVIVVLAVRGVRLRPTDDGSPYVAGAPGGRGDAGDGGGDADSSEDADPGAHASRPAPGNDTGSGPKA
jgi:hypothetical protein